MAIYSKILELINGIPRTVDLSTNTLSVQGLQINAATGGGAFTQSAHSATTSYTVVWPATQAGGSNYVLANDGAGNLSWIASASGSVTSVSVATANGFAGTSSGGSTPSLTLSTTVTGILYGNGTSVAAAVAGNFPILNQNTTGTAANVTATSNSTLTTLSSLSLPTSQLSGQVTLSQLPTIGADTILGNASGSSAVPAALTSTQVTALLNQFTTTLQGLVPGSGGGTTNFLRADGTWAAPTVSPGAISLAQNEILVGNSSNVAAAVTLSGDASIVSSGALTLATVNSNVGSFGSSTAIPSFTVNAKGLITAASTNAVIAPAGTLSGTALNSSVVSSSLTSLGIQAQALNMGSYQINNLATPSVSTDAATKGYVDSAISGLYWQGPAAAYSNSNVPLTGSTPLVIDGYTVANGNLIILGNQTTASQNGEYSVAISGGSYTLTANGLPSAAGDAWLILNGTVYGDSAFVANAAVPSATFTEFAGPTAYTFNSPLSLSGRSVSITQANSSTNGYLSSTDWNTFNNKQAAGNYITALTGDATASGPGSAALTLATVNSNIGTFASVTVNAKGLVTAAANLSGDATTSGSALTLATVNSNVGTFTNATITVNAKGLITAASNGTTAVTSVSVASSNGFAGTSSGGATPTLTLSTTVNAPVLAGNGTAISAATTTGTGSTVVLSASPVLTGTVTAANATFSGNVVIPTAQITAVYGGSTTLSANTTYAIRWGLPANSETAGKFYLADWTTSSYDLFWVTGLYNSTSSTSTGATITITTGGNFTLGSADTTFGSSDQGKPCWLGAAGAFTPNSTFSPSSGNANTKLGIVTGASTISVSPQVMGVS